MTASRSFSSNNAGGILGGISTGQPVVARFAVKPTSSILTPRRTVDRYGRETEISTKGRHDPCVGIRAVPIGEAMVACVIADHYLRQRGQVGDTSGVAVSAAGADGAAARARGEMDDAHQRIQAAVAAFARGDIVIVADDDDRENEGDLFVAASLCTPEKMAFIIRNTSGIVCAPLAPEEARRLHLDPMVALNDAPLGTAFTVSVDVRHGLTTGISAEERTNTVRALANGNSGAADFVRPGHVFPLVAKEGGVLMRSGHTEACVDLCRLAGLPPVGVLAELMNDDGTVMRGPEIAAFAERHKLQRISIAESDRLPAGARQADRARRRVSGRIRDRHADRLCLPDAVRSGLSHGVRLWPHRRRQERADAAASRQHHFRRLRRRQADPPHAGPLQGRGQGRAGAAARRHCRRAGGRRYRNPAKPRPAKRARGNGARSASARRSSRISASVSIRLLTSSRRMTYVGLSGFGIEIAGTEPIDGMHDRRGIARRSSNGGRK